MAILRLQSAMEYLMTYGWAILIIAVVLAALFGLGFFSSANFAPKVTAGACQVYRPNGPGTTTYINTEGVCSNELPSLVGQFGGAASANVQINGLSFSSTTGNTISFWMDGKGAGTAAAFGAGTGNSIGYGSGTFGIGGSCGVTSSTVANTFVFVAVTTTGSNAIVYINGAAKNTGCSSLSTAATLFIGSAGSSSGFNGMIANVQVYNASLNANDIYSLYTEGLGGIPFNLNNLVGWWPLNGNPNDYSGNLDNGAATGINYVSSWTSAYTAP